MKKVISLVLVVALVLGSFGMAFAADETTAETTAPQTTTTATKGLSDINDSANVDAIRVVNDLAIVTGYPDQSFKPAQNVTRAEFAAMIVRALGVPDSALAGFTTSKFTDTEGYGWAVQYLGYCSAKGIMEGYGDGTVRPGANITVNEAVTMVCRALGYVKEAKELVGTWPANYTALGQQLKLFRDMSADGIINRENAAQIIYNALTVKNVYIDADGVTQYQKGETIFIDNEPVDLGVTWLALNGGKTFKDGKAVVLSTADVDNAIINITEFIGANVKAYTNEDGDIIAVDVLSTFLTGDYDASENTLEVGDVKYAVPARIADELKYRNADGVATVAEKFINAAEVATSSAIDLTKDVTATFAVNVDGKTIKDVYSVHQWKSAKVFQYEEDMLDTKACKLNGEKFKKNNNLEIDKDAFILAGVDDIENIKVDNVVEVFLKGAVEKADIAKVAVGTKVVEGTITKVDGANYYIDGTKYGAIKDADGNVDFGTIGDGFELANSGKAYLTEAGKIAFWKLDDSTAGNYAMYYGAVAGSGFNTSTYTVKLLTKDGETVEATLTSIDVVEAGISTNGAVGDNKNAKLVKYSMNKAGKVNAIKKVDSATFNGKLNEANTRIGTTSVKEGVVVFAWNGKDDWELSSIGKISKKEVLNSSESAIQSDLSNGKIAALAVADKKYVGGSDKYGVINKVSKAVDADNDKYVYVDGFIDGTALSAFTDNQDIDSAYKGYVSKPYGTASLYKITVDGDGIVTDITTAAIKPADDGITMLANKYVSAVSVANAELTIKDVALWNDKDAKTEVVGVTSKVAIYVWNADDKAFEVATSISALKGKEVVLYQTDKDADGYDIVLAWSVDE